MPLREHLLELRKRLFLTSIGLVLGALVAWFVYQPMLAALQAPLEEAAREQGKLIRLNFSGLASALDMQIKVSLFLGVFLSCPWWLYQLWAFITPGLTSKERRYAFGFLGASVPLFLGGALLAWWVLPHAVTILAGFVPDGASNLADAQGYLSFVMRLVLAFGIAFVMPVILVVLNFAGLLRAASIAKGWRWAVLIAFVFAAVMTPTPDALTMIFVALPICALYFGALGIAYLHDRRADKREAARLAL
ncbi:twin-arginine translocase subunit TatC [Cellulosimicrobium arenosum]|uniref:Sec-independent protein translocase protein TatC n=1 Tax=Cellulosimicrobium arenosum TaxID=2708133 RepID=A0A927IYW9_9MICO|nr:twin-arginine translocase subunit TatC [Cellulosimicrobium arenosum]MBD8077813.1 twin-arginine translocase subunit TatC [Cellulosimicrobium arenosum]